MNSPDLCNTLSDSETEQCIKDIFDMVDTIFENRGIREGSLTGDDYKKFIHKEIHRALDFYMREGKCVTNPSKVINSVGKKLRSKYVTTVNTLKFRFQVIYEELLAKSLITEELLDGIKGTPGMEKKIQLLLSYERFKNNFDSLSPGITQE